MKKLLFMMLSILISSGVAAQTEKIIQVFKEGQIVEQFRLSDLDYIEVNERLVAPKSLNANSRISSVMLTWGSVEGASSYNIYRSGDGKEFTIHATGIGSCEYVDSRPLGGHNYYRVCAVDDAMHSGAMSDVAFAVLSTEVSNNEIRYVTTDNSMIDIYSCKNTYGNEPFDKAIVSHTYENGIGIIRCEGDINAMNDFAMGNAVGINMVELQLPNTIKRLGIGAICGTALTELRLPDNLSYVDAYGLGNNKNLERFTGKNVSDDGRCVIIDKVLYAFAPVGVTGYAIPSYVERVSDYAFAWCTELKSITLNEGVKSIGADVFLECPFEEVAIPASLEEMHSYAFRECPDIQRFTGNANFVSSDGHCLWTIDPYFGDKRLMYFAGPEITEYVIPEGIQTLENYCFQYAKSMRKVTLPQSLTSFGSVAFYGCNTLEEIHGKYATPDHKSIVIEGTLVYFIENGITEYAVPEEAITIGQSALGYKNHIETITMSDNVQKVEGYGYIFEQSPALKTVTISAGMKNIGWDPFLDCENTLETVYMRAPIPPKVIHQFADKPESGHTYEYQKLTMYVPRESYDLYMADSGWKPLKRYMKPYDYDNLDEFKPEWYCSTDYSADGEVTIMQSATVGAGIDLVFMGDGFVDRDMVAEGRYEQTMMEAMEKFFSIEPYKSFRNRFNVYSVKVVSMNEEWGDDARHAISENDATAFRYASAIPEINKDHLYVNVIYNAPADGSWYGRSYTRMYYADGSYVAYNMEGVNNVLIHEAGGHGFAKLADEYVEWDAAFTDSPELDRLHGMNWYHNVDYHNTPAEILWSKMMADSRYDGQVGIYEGGFTYSRGIYRPTENSMMRYNDTPFNAPSREAIYKAIMRLSEGEAWQYDYEEFANYDEINRQAEKSGVQQAPTRGLEEQSKHFMECHQAPKVMSGSWRSALEVDRARAQQRDADKKLPPAMR